MSVIDYAKAHPVMVGGGVLVAIIAVVLVLNSGGGAPATVTSSAQGDASTGAALASAQLQASSHAQDVQAQVAIADSNNYTAKAIAEIQAAVAGKSLDVQQSLGSMQISADQATTINGQTLSAQVQNKQTEAQVQNTAAMYGTINNQTNALVEQSKIAAQPKGLFSWLFG